MLASSTPTDTPAFPQTLSDPPDQQRLREPRVLEQRITLTGLDWATYQQMTALLNERTKARLVYDRGTLEN